MKMENDIFGKLWIKSREKRKKETRKKGGWRGEKKKRKRGKKKETPPVGFEPTTLRLTAARSAN